MSKNIFKYFNIKFKHILYAVILNIFMSYIIRGIAVEVLNYIIGLSGEVNINFSNFKELLSNPILILGFGVYLILISIAAYFELYLIIKLCTNQLSGSNFEFKREFLNFKNRISNSSLLDAILFFIYIILIIPLAEIGFSISLTKGIYIPQFITDELFKTDFGAFFTSVFILALVYINFRLIYILVLAVIKNQSFFKNIRESLELTKKYGKKMILKLSLFEIVIYFSRAILIYFLLKFLSIATTFTDSLWIEAVVLTIIKTVNILFVTLTKLGIVLILLEIIEYREYKSIENIKNKKNIFKNKKLVIILSMTIFISGVLYNGMQIYILQPNSKIEIVAHRGFAKKGVENSIEALEGAAETGADFSEMDLMLTKDKKFIVMHDYNLKRLSNLNKNVRDMNLDEIKQLNITQDSFTTKIPTFEEYVQKAKELNIKLLVELKPHGYEPNNYAELIVEEMKRLGIDKEYKYMSLNLELMQKIKKLAPQMKVGYVIPIQFGQFSDDGVDFWVIEDFSYREILVLQAILNKKELYIWTVNEKSRIEYYLNTLVTGLISDNPDEIKQIKDNNTKYNSFFDRVFKLI